MAEAKSLVLVENEETAGGYAWKDVTGERYHFPNQYVNKVVPGRRFIYYSGTRGTGGLRKEPDYFGTGVIGPVYPDPEAPPGKKEWIAEIADYQPFPSTVPFRSEDGTLTELGSKSPPSGNYWGTGVREINPERFQAILAAGGVAQPKSKLPSPVSGPLADANSGQIWKPMPLNEGAPGGRAYDYRNLSARAKDIGDEAERLFYERLRASEPDPEKLNLIRWVAQEQETPGYDIEDRREAVLRVYEVKGTTAGKFVGIDLTANELKSAKDLGAAYSLVLVAGVFSPKPRFRVIRNPAALMASGVLMAEPTGYRVTLAGELPGASQALGD